MPAPIAITRTDYSAADLRKLASRSRGDNQKRRLLAIAAILRGKSREEAAEIGGMDAQTLRDWVKRFNAEGPEGLLNRKVKAHLVSQLTDEERKRIIKLVRGGPPDWLGEGPWTRQRLSVAMLLELNIACSLATISTFLEKNGLGSVLSRRNPRPYRWNPSLRIRSGPILPRRKPKRSPPKAE